MGAVVRGGGTPQSSGTPLGRHRWIAMSALAGAMLAGLGWWSWHVAPHADERPGASRAGTGWIQPATGDAPAANSGQPLLTGLEGLPRSLQGTQVDGEVQVDAAGQLRLDQGVRRLFDYFLALVGEEPSPRVRQRIVAYLRSHLPAPAAAQAQALLDRYMAYEQARGQMGQGIGQQTQADGASTAMSLQALAQRLAQLAALRQQYFSVAERTAFFGDEDAQDRYTLARLDVLQDKGLNAVEKAQRLRQLAQSLPPDMQASLTVQDRYQDLSALTADWKARGGTPEALREARVQLVGPDATERLEALDQQRAQWAQRVKVYQGQKAAVMADVSLSAAQRDEALARLRDSAFTPQERLRLDAMAAPAGGLSP